MAKTYNSQAKSSYGNISVILHGGAGALRTERARKKIPYLIKARESAWEKLLSGCSAEEAAVAAIRVMEESEYFNAGYGGYPNVNGIVLQDIGLMRGNRDFVSLLNIRKVKHPSSIALDMLSNQSSLISVWTQELMNKIDNSDLETKERYGWVATHEELLSPYVLDLLAENQAEFDKAGNTHGTVGCVTRDKNGNLAACTCTGGVNTKKNGRIGDSPIIGSGVFADNEICALSTTGYGESFLQSQISGFVISEMRSALNKDPNIFIKDPELPKRILMHEFKELNRKCPSKGGAIIVLSQSSQPAYYFNSEMASIAYKTITNSDLVEQDAGIATRDGRFIRE
jgi:beta-aspartyl-peptidase (threonine type)